MHRPQQAHAVRSQAAIPGPVNWESILLAYYNSACRAIKYSMPVRLRSAYDPEDFVSEAIVELMSTPARLIDFGPKLILVVAKRRMIDAARSPKCRGVNLDVETIDLQPSVALSHEASECHQFMLNRTDDPIDRAMLALRCQGHNTAEIAELTGLGVRKVQRFFKHFMEANEPY